MYQHIAANQNPLITQFQSYTNNNPTFVPFQNNQLINNNVHVLNNLNSYVQNYKNAQSIQPIQPVQHNTIKNNSNSSSNKKNISTGKNIIESMLQPIIVLKNNNKDVGSNYDKLKKIHDDMVSTKGDTGYEITNMPYKCIIRDKIITKKVGDVKAEDLLVHRVIHGIDNDTKKFTIDEIKKKNELTRINCEIEIEFAKENLDKNKAKFEKTQTFIRNLAYKENIFDDNRKDCIEFYKEQQRKAEEGIMISDSVLTDLIDSGIIDKNELPIDNGSEMDNTDVSDLDLDAIAKNVNIGMPKIVNSNKSSNGNSSHELPSGPTEVGCDSNLSHSKHNSNLSHSKHNSNSSHELSSHPTEVGRNDRDDNIKLNNSNKMNNSSNNSRTRTNNFLSNKLRANQNIRTPVKNNKK